MEFVQKQEQRFFSRAQTAKYLGISTRKLDQWVKSGRLLVVRAGRRILIDRVDADRFYLSLKSQPAQGA